MIAVGIMFIGAGAQPFVQVMHHKELPFVLHLGAPRGTAHTKSAQAIRVAESIWDPSLFTHHPYTVAYGSYQSKVSTRIVGGLQPVGNLDVWAITVSGLNEPGPGTEVGEPDGSFRDVTGPNIHTEVILIDDSTGKYLESIGY